MTISAIGASSSPYAYQASYPGLATAQALAPKPAISSPVIADTIPSIEIPAPRENADPLPVARFRSAKGEWRTDAAAPPTVEVAGNSFSFGDLVDIANPLQHIPGINWVYQHLTGDTINPTANVAGGFLYGGALGGVMAMAASTIGELWNGSANDGSEPVATASAITSKFGGLSAPGAIA